MISDLTVYVSVSFKVVKKCSQLWDVTIKKALSWEISIFHKDNLTLSRKRNSIIICVRKIYFLKKLHFCSNTPRMKAGAASNLMYLLPLPQLYTASKSSLLWSLAVSNLGPYEMREQSLKVFLWLLAGAVSFVLALSISWVSVQFLHLVCLISLDFGCSQLFLTSVLRTK